jgi:hemoglobin
MTLKHVLVVLLAAGCATGGDTKPTPKKSLYERLGGKDAITLVVAEGATRIAADQRINARFANTDMNHLKAALVDQICEASGGPCKYIGKPMKLAHAGLKIADDEFTALVEDLKGALDKFKVPQAEQKELLGALASMKADVVNQ